MSGDLVALLEAAGLGGRGGAGFSTAVKLASARRHRADLVVNACDGELGAVKDAWVVAHHLDELVAGATAVAAESRGRVRYAAHRASDTAARLAAAGLDVLEVPDHYVSSEESALVSLARGGLARPMTKRAPFVAGGTDSRGRRIRPTLVLNAETTWRVAQVQRHGVEWFRSFGTPEEPGPRLVSVHGHVRRPVVHDTQAGVAVHRLVGAAEPWDPASALLVGGLGGIFLSPAEGRTSRWSSAELAAYGGSTGPGLVEVLDPRVCPLADLLARVRFAAGESAGQCGPCMFGLPALAHDLATLVDRPDRAALARVQGRLGLLRDRGACRFPDGVSRLTASALRVHAGHLQEHAAGHCSLQRAGRTSHVPA